MPNSYDSAWSKWHVQPGEIWAVGPHIIACGDHEDGAFEAFRRRYPERPSMTFVDPPWTPALATGYRTKARVARKVDFARLTRLVLSAAGWAGGAIVVEHTAQNGPRAVLLLEAEAVGLDRVATWEITYFRTRPALLHLFRHRDTVPDRAIPDFTGLDDEDAPAVAIAAFTRTGDLVFDPCTGQGLTAETAAASGRRFVGIELHPGRMARALDRLSKVTGERPAPIERL